MPGPDHAPAPVAAVAGRPHGRRRGHLPESREPGQFGPDAPDLVLLLLHGARRGRQPLARPAELVFVEAHRVRVGEGPRGQVLGGAGPAREPPQRFGQVPLGRFQRAPGLGRLGGGVAEQRRLLGQGGGRGGIGGGRERRELFLGQPPRVPRLSELRFRGPRRRLQAFAAPDQLADGRDEGGRRHHAGGRRRVGARPERPEVVRDQVLAGGELADQPRFLLHALAVLAEVLVQRLDLVREPGDRPGFRRPVQLARPLAQGLLRALEGQARLVQRPVAPPPFFGEAGGQRRQFPVPGQPRREGVDLRQQRGDPPDALQQGPPFAEPRELAVDPAPLGPGGVQAPSRPSAIPRP